MNIDANYINMLKCIVITRHTDGGGCQIDKGMGMIFPYEFRIGIF